MKAFLYTLVLSIQTLTAINVSGSFLTLSRELDTTLEASEAKKGSSWMYGFELSLEHIENYQPYLKLHSQWCTADFGTINELKRESNNTLIEVNVGFTVGGLCPLEWQATPYIGLGWFKHKLRFSGALDATTTYRHWYIPIGFITSLTFCSCFQLGIDIATLGQIDSTKTYQECDNISYRLDRKWPLRVQIPLTLKARSFHVSIVPYLLHFVDGKVQNNPLTLQSIIKNRFDDYGCKLTVTYPFGN